MRKFVALFVLVLYTVFSCGITVYNHYCGEKLSYSSFSVGKSCSACGKKSTKDCCKDTKEKFSIDDSQQLSKQSVVSCNLSDFVALLPSVYYFIQPVAALLNAQSDQFYVFETGPPKTPIYIQIRSLRI